MRRFVTTSLHLNVDLQVQSQQKMKIKKNITYAGWQARMAIRNKSESYESGKTPPNPFTRDLQGGVGGGEPEILHFFKQKNK
jgi:hypothetical protein